MATDIILTAQQLKKHFGAVQAVKDVSLNIKRGEIFGFLGPNGAGKTTTISMILGLMYPDAGTVEVFGESVTPQRTAVLRRVGAMVGSPALLLSFSARHNLELLACLYPEISAARIDEVLVQMDLQTAAHRHVRGFSTGMKQRLGLALALLHRPELLILDEPTNGMDPAGMQEIRGLLRSLADQGTTIFLSSHLLHEIEQVCDRVAVLNHGNIVAQGSVREMLAGESRVRVRSAQPDQTVRTLQELNGAKEVQLVDGYVEVRGVTSEEVLTSLVKHGLTPQEVFVAQADLEQVFLELTK
jgi:ABC-2 type transport system ATP-binding protein